MKINVLMIAVWVEILSVACIHAADPILHYTFNEGNGSSVANQGSVGAAGNLVTKDDVDGSSVTDAWTADSEGVSGTAGDYAYDPLSGTGGNSGVAQAGSLIPAMNNVNRLSLTFWYRCPDGTPKGTFFRARDGDADGFMAQFETASSYPNKIRVNNLSLGNNDTSDAVFTNANVWVFAAVTFDTDTDTFSFYKGLTDSAVETAGTDPDTSSTHTGTIDDELYTGPFNDFMIDNIRFYTNVLSLAELEVIRNAEANPPPSGTVISIR